MTLLLFCFGRPALFPSEFCKLQPFRLGVNSLEKCHGEVKQIFGVFAFQRAVVGCVIPVLPYAVGKFSQFLRQHFVVEQPVQPRCKRLSGMRIQTHNIAAGQELFCGNIDTKPEHRSSRIPTLDSDAGCGFFKYFGDFLRRVLRRADLRDLCQTDDSLYSKLIVQRNAGCFGCIPIWRFFELYILLSYDEICRSVAVSTNAECLKPVLPFVHLIDPQRSSYVECDAFRTASRAVCYHLGHFNPRLPFLKQSLQRRRPFVEGAVA